ncbi:MAG: biotin--[acetyl-CoA-carboxylase] ligase [Ignavibacteria bacterium]|nr:biotin--[acetyl-CoA-carboxylase] ligase [Ignavibacteria bacterium]
MDSREFIKKINRANLFRDVVILEKVDSTGSFARQNIHSAPALVSADFQSSGRGRFSRMWLSEKNKNLTFTLVLDFYLENQNIFIVNFYISLMIYFTLSKIIADKNIILKWPNDLLVDGKKICGILTESENLQNHVKRFFIGIGLNVNQEKFTHELKNNVTSLKNVTGFDYDRYDLLFELSKKILLYKDALFLPERILYLWKMNSHFLGREVRFRQSLQSDVIMGKAVDLSDDGAVVIVNAEGKKVKYYSGEISFIF